MILFSISVILFSIHFSSVSLQTYTFSIALIWSDCYSTNITTPPILRLHQYYDSTNVFRIVIVGTVEFLNTIDEEMMNQNMTLTC